MPIVNGYEATKKIKAQLKGQATTIIALSASVFDEEQSIILSAGCDDFVRKPFRENIILEKISEHLGVEYIYEEIEESFSLTSTSTAQSIESLEFEENLIEVCKERLKPMPREWIEQLNLFAQQLDDELIMLLIEQIPEEQSDLNRSTSHFVENFRYDIIIELTKSK